MISYTAIDKNVEELKSALISKIKKRVGSVLSRSDWRVIREIDGGTAVSDAWKTFRNETRQHGNTLESGIESFASVQAVKNFQNHDIIEVRYISTRDDEGNEVIGPETEDHHRSVDKTYWDWPVSPDAEVDPYPVSYTHLTLPTILRV